MLQHPARLRLLWSRGDICLCLVLWYRRAVVPAPSPSDVAVLRHPHEGDDNLLIRKNYFPVRFRFVYTFGKWMSCPCYKIVFFKRSFFQELMWGRN